MSYELAISAMNDILRELQRIARVLELLKVSENLPIEIRSVDGLIALADYVEKNPGAISLKGLADLYEKAMLVHDKLAAARRLLEKSRTYIDLPVQRTARALLGEEAMKPVKEAAYTIERGMKTLVDRVCQIELDLVQVALRASMANRRRVEDGEAKSAT